jgi:hypothetical protein
MPLGRGLTGSEVKYIQALSPVALAAAGSSAAIDLSGFGFATLVVNAGSINTGAEFHVLRSATSNGTFNGFGASIGQNAGTVIRARSWVVGSPVWHKLYYTNGTGSMIAAALIEAQQPRKTPVDQDSKTTVNSTVL